MILNDHIIQIIAMQLVADQEIPGIQSFFSPLFKDIILLPSEAITTDRLQHADALITRTTIPINAALLKETPIRFVGCPASGSDHVDHAWLKQHHITFSDAKGANAFAVTEYVIAVIAALHQQKKIRNIKRASVIGCGHVGTLVAKIFGAMGLSVLCYDPFLTNATTLTLTDSLEKALQHAQLLTLHTSLTKDGQHPTYHLLNQSKITLLPPGATIINASRGAVIEEEALLKHRKDLTICADVFESEPNISLRYLSRTHIATPHIAGYSQQAKCAATHQIAQSAYAFFKERGMGAPPPPAVSPSIDALCDLVQSPGWVESVLSVINLCQETNQFKKDMANASVIGDAFRAVRQAYVLRPTLISNTLP